MILPSETGDFLLEIRYKIDPALIENRCVKKTGSGALD
jgi:hypothetical protein